MNTNKEYDDAIREYIGNLHNGDDAILDLGIIGERVSDAKRILKNKPVHLQAKERIMTLFDEEVWLFEANNVPVMIRLDKFDASALADGYVIRGLDKGFVSTYLTGFRTAVGTGVNYRYRVAEPIKPLTDEEILELFEGTKSQKSVTCPVTKQATNYYTTEIPAPKVYYGDGINLVNAIPCPPMTPIKATLAPFCNTKDAPENKNPVISIQPTDFVIETCPYLPMIRPKRGSRMYSKLMVEIMSTTPNAVEFSSLYNGIMADVSDGTIYSDSLSGADLTNAVQRADVTMNYLYTCQRKRATYRQALGLIAQILHQPRFHLPVKAVTIPKMTPMEFLESAMKDHACDYDHFGRWVGYLVLDDKLSYDPLDVVSIEDFIEVEVPKRTLIYIAILSTFVGYPGCM